MNLAALLKNSRTREELSKLVNAAAGVALVEVMRPAREGMGCNAG